MLLFNGTAGYAVGIDLGVNYIRGLLVDLEGNVISEHERGLKRHDAEFAIGQLAECIELLIQKAPASPYGVVGIGAGVPGIVDDNGMILFAPNLKWREVPLQQQLEERFGLPVTIDNEANAGAQGEQKYGAGRGIPNQIYVSVGIGIGTGIILKKELYKGASGFSGELGHLSIEYDGKPCSCGNRGCWELYASENALLERAASLGYDSLEELLAAAADGNESVLELIRSIGDYMGAGIANIVNVFNPNVVIIGNRMSLAAEWLEPAVQAAVDRRSLPYHRERMRILFAELREQSAVRGAAYYAISKFFSKIKS
jgi:predicted NBD/HSP70 family sugar kinase